MEEIWVTRSAIPPMEEYIDEIRSLWDTRWLTNAGQKHEQFRAQLREYLGVRDIELLVNGHMSLELTFQALGLRGEVITTPLTFASTTQAIVRSGLTPVFCDVKEDFTMDPEGIESLITERTTAIVPVHAYGTVCDVERIARIAKKHNLKVIYDAAHAFGVRVNGRGIGTFGDASCFSFHATKAFHSVEGGAVSFSDPNIGQQLRQRRNFGLQGREQVVSVGTNAKMNELCAAMGICNLRYVDDWIARRRDVVQRYRENLSDVKGIRWNPEQAGVQSGYAYFPIVIEDSFGCSRDAVLNALAAKGIGARRYFYPLTSREPCYNGRFAQAVTPRAEWLSRHVLTLPLYPELTQEQVDEICHSVEQCGR